MKPKADKKKTNSKKAEAKPKVVRRRAINLRLRFELIKAASNKCAHCGAQAPKATLEIDHIVPLSRGGSNAPENLQVLCFSCNRGKGALAPAPPRRIKVRHSEARTIGSQSAPKTKPSSKPRRAKSNNGKGRKCKS